MTFHFYLTTIYFNIIIPLMSRSSYWSLPSWTSHQNHLCASFRLMPATCSAHLILLDFAILSVSGESLKGKAMPATGRGGL
jgi:hypothetical protein